MRDALAHPASLARETQVSLRAQLVELVVQPVHRLEEDVVVRTADVV